MAEPISLRDVITQIDQLFAPDSFPSIESNVHVAYATDRKQRDEDLKEALKYCLEISESAEMPAQCAMQAADALVRAAAAYATIKEQCDANHPDVPGKCEERTQAEKRMALAKEVDARITLRLASYGTR